MGYLTSHDLSLFEYQRSGKDVRLVPKFSPVSFLGSQEVDKPADRAKMKERPSQSLVGVNAQRA